MPKNTYIAKMNIHDACKNHPQKSICSQVRKYFPYVDFGKAGCILNMYERLVLIQTEGEFDGQRLQCEDSRRL